jgi:transcriptional regulator with XRE-family HTH domain
VKQYPSSSAAAPRLVSRDRAKALKPDLALFAQRVRAQEDLTQRDVADDAGTTHQNVSLWEKPHTPDAPTVLHVVEMQDEARPLGLGYLRWQADKLGGVQVVETPAVIDEPEPSRSYRLVRECTDVLRANAERCADGHDDAGELTQLEHELHETTEGLAALTEHRAYLVRLLAQRRGGQP